MVLTPTGLRIRGRTLPVTIGKGGIVPHKVEGDGGTPTGSHRITGILYRPDRLARPTPWARPIGPLDGWSDDVTDPDYNTQIRRPHPFSHERLRRADPLYDLIILTGWNAPIPQAGRGSAIFMHRWRRPGYPTEGCVAMAPAHLLWLAQTITHHTRLIIQA